MEIQELKKDKAYVQFIREFISDPLYSTVKDAFVAHVPSGKESENSTAVAHGMYMGTAYVFNQMENIARTIPEQTIKSSGKKDPDLEE